MGVEPTYQPWEGRILPMNYTRIWNCEAIIAKFPVKFNHFLSPTRNFSGGRGRALRRTCQLSRKYSSTRPPRAIRYTPKAEKVCFRTYCISPRIASRDTTKAVTEPKIRIAPS